MNYCYGNKKLKLYRIKLGIFKKVKNIRLKYKTAVAFVTFIVWNLWSKNLFNVKFIIILFKSLCLDIRGFFFDFFLTKI